MDLATRAQRQLPMQLSLEAISSELSIYDATIAAGTPLPAPRYSRERRLLLGPDVVFRGSTMEYVESLRRSARRMKKGIAFRRLMYAQLDMRIFQRNVRQARQELEAADFANAVAMSMTLPQAMGKSAVSRGVGTRSDIRETSQ
jgi:hypothetical protein